MAKEHGDIDGWHIEVYQQHDVMFPWRADGFDGVWTSHQSSEGFDKENVLSALACKIGVDRKRVLAVFDIG